ncbi:3454_t:CDS:2, partial [Racocetra persica]
GKSIPTVPFGNDKNTPTRSHSAYDNKKEPTVIKPVNKNMNNVMIQAPLNIVVKIDTMMKGLIEMLMEAGFDSNSVNHKNGIISIYKMDSYEELSVSQSKGDNAIQIKYKEISHLLALNDKTFSTIKPKVMPCDNVAGKDRDVNSKMMVSNVEYDGMY